MSVNLKLSPTAKVIAAREAQNFLDEANAVTALVIATVDGFDVASPMRAGDAPRVAAMASSISAISSVVSQEANLGRNKSVTIDTESGFAMVYSVHRDDAELVINVIADGSAILGQVAYRIAQFARTLAEA